MAEHQEVSRWLKISRWLKEKIEGGVYPAGGRLPSEHELAAHFQCSRETVRHAMGMLEAEGILKRVRGSGTFVNQKRAALKKGGMRIAVLMASQEKAGFSSMLFGIEEVLSRQEGILLLGITKNCPVKEEEYLRRMIADGVQGILLESAAAFPNGNEMLYRKIMQDGVPIVFLNEFQDAGNPKSYAAIDEARAGETAAELLLKKIADPLYSQQIARLPEWK